MDLIRQCDGVRERVNKVTVELNAVAAREATVIGNVWAAEVAHRS